MDFSTHPVLSMTQATIFQGENPVLTDVNFAVEQHEFVFLIGRTGSGKSSLLKTLYADLPLKVGHSEVVGYNLSKIKSKEVPYLRRKIGIIFQDFQLFTDRSVSENLTFVLKATGWKDSLKIKERISDVLIQVGLVEAMNKMPHQLSGGEQQRIVIARALLNNPSILLADELKLKADAPTLYQVKAGDTLWDIAGLYLQHPWLWPRLWKLNPQVNNPHLIYPGDELHLQFDADGQPILTLNSQRVTASSSDVTQNQSDSLAAGAIKSVAVRALSSGAKGQNVPGSLKVLQADHVVVATGSYTAPLLRTVGVNLPIYPGKGYSATFKILKPELAPLVSTIDDAKKVAISRLGDELRVAGTIEVGGFDLTLDSLMQGG